MDPHAFCCWQSQGQAKVAQLDNAVLTHEEDIRGLDVPVHNPLRVHVYQSPKKLPCYYLNLQLVQGAALAERILQASCSCTTVTQTSETREGIFMSPSHRLGRLVDRQDILMAWKLPGNDNSSYQVCFLRYHHMLTLQDGLPAATSVTRQAHCWPPLVAMKDS